jgi:hypothetical protein
MLIVVGAREKGDGCVLVGGGICSSYAGSRWGKCSRQTE